MMEFYAQIKWVHICAVMLSGSLFLLRGGTALAGAAWPYAAPVRYASYTIDTVLLSAALMLATILPSGFFANHWLTMKLALIVAYIVLGVFTLRRGNSNTLRRACFAGAIVAFVLVIGVALAHHPLGWWQLLRG
ncbi:MAG: SirB2 family protein [Proteobacteria bacterium]|nr:SirB2 family protein [Pseudomonadota bacterium]MBS0566813.1 SirB2 family protein [Pseudomonadota bacterium]